MSYAEDNLRAAAAATTTVLTNQQASIESVMLLAADNSRVGFMVFNDSTDALYLALGNDAAVDQFTVKIAAGGYYESPAGFNFVGVVNGAWTGTNGYAFITSVGA